MFKRQNFCHVASNNRNQVKVGVFVYRTTDSLQTVSASGYFNDSIIDINLHDLIIHEKVDAADATKVERNVLCVTERTLENVGTAVIKSKWDGDIEQAIEDLQTYVDSTFVRKDGTSIITGPLKMRSSVSFKCAIAPSWDGVGFYKLNDNDSLTLIASIETTDGLCPAVNNTYNIGKASYKWKDLYLGGKAYLATINNGQDISVPASAGTMALTSDIKNGVLTIQKNGSTVNTFSANQSTNVTVNLTIPTTLTTIDDVTITNPIAGQVLTYDGSKWENTTYTQANTDLSNLTGIGKNIGNWSTNISNYLTEIPQDIKLELDNGTLKLKAGSKIYVPNGVGVFDIISINSDITVNCASATGKTFIRVYPGGSAFGEGLITSYKSGSDPTGITAFFYDTTTNKITYVNNGVSDGNRFSFPIAAITVSNGSVTSIDQVFNGFGYIGSTIFALPGVKGLAPNGFNADGTLKNNIKSVSNVLTYTLAGTYDFTLACTGAAIGAYFYGYDVKTNKVIKTNTGEAYNGDRFIYGRASINNGSITSFSTNKVFHAVDYNEVVKYNEFNYLVNNIVDKSQFMGIDTSSPIARSLNTEYQATRNCWIYHDQNANNNGNFQINGVSVYTTNWHSGVTAASGSALVFVAKGQTWKALDGASVTEFGTLGG